MSEPVPPERRLTLRQGIRAALRDGPATLRELSEVLRVSEKQLPGHLDHLSRSLAREGKRLHVHPAECLSCGFTTRDRGRYTRPGRCPQCRGNRLTHPTVEIR